MTTAFRPRTLVLFMGDMLSLILALWLSLFLRAFEVPPQWLFVAHLEPFSLLFVAWVAVFGYIWSVWSRLGRVERDLAEVSRRVDKGARR